MTDIGAVFPFVLLAGATMLISLQRWTADKRETIKVTKSGRQR
jgi:hypothetical protein